VTNSTTGFGVGADGSCAVEASGGVISIVSQLERPKIARNSRGILQLDTRCRRRVRSGILDT